MMRMLGMVDMDVRMLVLVLVLVRVLMRVWVDVVVMRVSGVLVAMAVDMRTGHLMRMSMMMRHGNDVMVVVVMMMPRRRRRGGQGIAARGSGRGQWRDTPCRCTRRSRVLMILGQALVVDGREPRSLSWSV